jgi:hypothetical protein
MAAWQWCSPGNQSVTKVESTGSCGDPEARAWVQPATGRQIDDAAHEAKEDLG